MRSRSPSWEAEQSNEERVCFHLKDDSESDLGYTLDHLFFHLGMPSLKWMALRVLIPNTRNPFDCYFKYNGLSNI